MIPWIIDRTSEPESFGSYYDGGGYDPFVKNSGFGDAVGKGTSDPTEDTDGYCPHIHDGEGSRTGDGYGGGIGMGAGVINDRQEASGCGMLRSLVTRS